MYFQYLNCCGIREIAMIQTYRKAEDALKQFLENTALREASYPGEPELHRRQDRFRYAIFSQASRRVVNSGYGFNFAELIEKENLGSLSSTDFHRNPNSRNMVKVWIWTIDWDAVNAYRKGKSPKPNRDSHGRFASRVEAAMGREARVKKARIVSEDEHTIYGTAAEAAEKAKEIKRLEAIGLVAAEKSFKLVKLSD